MATATKTKKYIAHGGNIRVIVRPGRSQRNEYGENVVVQKPIRVEFKDHPQGFETDDPKIQEALEASPSFNVHFHCEGEEPGRLRPSVAEVMGWAATAVYDGDLERLGELLEEERNGHRRSDVIESLNQQVETVRTRQASEAALAEKDAGSTTSETERSSAAGATEKPKPKPRKPAKKPAAKKS